MWYETLKVTKVPKKFINFILFAALGSEIYIFGGDTQDPADKSIKIMNDLHVLDTATLKWHKVNTENAPPPRRNHSSTIVGELVFVFGGFDGNNRLADIHVLDTGTISNDPKLAPKVVDICARKKENSICAFAAH